MDRHDFDIKILDYLVGEALPEAEKQEVEEWLAADENNRTYYRNMQVNYLRQRIALRESLIRRKKYPEYKRRKNAMRLYWATAASVVLMLSAGIFWFNRQTPEQTATVTGTLLPGKAKAVLFLSTGEKVAIEDEWKSIEETNNIQVIGEKGVISYIPDNSTETIQQQINHNRLVVGRGGEYKVILADGSTVWVNSETEFRYPVRFSGNNRIVELKGEAYFEVRADANRPFIVIANGVEIKATGTEFTVNSRKPHKVETVLVKGNVNVTKGEKSTPLYPNQMATYDHGKEVLTVEEIFVHKYIDWKNGNFTFSDDRLEDIMEKLSLWYDCEVIFKTPELKEICLSGEMKRYDRIHELLRYFEKGANLKFHIENKTIIVESK